MAKKVKWSGHKWILCLLCFVPSLNSQPTCNQKFIVEEASSGEPSEPLVSAFCQTQHPTYRGYHFNSKDLATDMKLYVLNYLRVKNYDQANILIDIYWNSTSSQYAWEKQTNTSAEEPVHEEVAEVLPIKEPRNEHENCAVLSGNVADNYVDILPVKCKNRQQPVLGYLCCILHDPTSFKTNSANNNTALNLELKHKESSLKKNKVSRARNFVNGLSVFLAFVAVCSVAFLAYRWRNPQQSYGNIDEQKNDYQYA